MSLIKKILQYQNRLYVSLVNLDDIGGFFEANEDALIWHDGSPITFSDLCRLFYLTESKPGTFDCCHILGDLTIHDVDLNF